MQSCANLYVENKTNNLIEVDFTAHTKKERRSTSLFKSNGVAKATAAEPIRDMSDFKKLQEYFIAKNQYRNYLVLTMGVLFGLRAGDLLSIKLHHIFKPDGQFKKHCDIVESKTRKFNNPLITKQLQIAITQYLSKLKCRPNYNDPLFVSNKRDENGNLRPITISQLDRILKKACKECGINDHISSHSFRKTFAYQLLQRNPDNDEVKFALQKMLNHNDFKTTLTYCGLTQDVLDKYRNEFEGLIMQGDF